jgi:phage tail sheath protein FI
MPVIPTYPGVYIEEVPSGVRTITGVATSITAFIGRARRGPTDRPQLVQSFAEFERVYGGLWTESMMSYAVHHYFLNGGRDALICRVHSEGARATLNLVDGFDLVAANEGTWGARLRARVDHDIRPLEPGEDEDSLFNLTFKDTGTGVVERYLNVSTDENHRRYVTRVLELESNLVRVAPPGTVPDDRPPAHGDPPAGADPLEDDASSVAFSGAADDDGSAIDGANISTPALEAGRLGIWMLDHADLFNLLCIPPFQADEDVDPATWNAAVAYAKRRRAITIVDSPSSWNEPADVEIDDVVAQGDDLTNAALYFPRIQVPDPLRENRVSTFAPCGAVAGIYSRTDAQRGVWKAPAGLDASLTGVMGLTAVLTDGQNGQLNPRGINCLRAFPGFGRVVWGARTLRGADQLASEWKYVPVRRLALFIEESLYRGTQWVVFEPNDEPLWAQIRLNVGAFLQNLFRQGAFQGRSPREAYFVKCDSESTTQNDINLGIVNILVGFAPLKPAEFVVIKIQQMAGQVEA